MGLDKGAVTADMIFAERQLQDKCQEQNFGLYTTFEDLTKAFNTVCREGLWKIMAKFMEKFISMVRRFHDGMQASVQDDGEHSQPLAVTNGVKQDRVPAPTLFSMMFSAMLTDACTGGKLFNLRNLQAKFKVQKDIAPDILFADDCALNASTQATKQESIDHFARACDDFCLTISTEKTKVMHQPAPANQYAEPTVLVNGEKLTVADKFVYLGSTLSGNVNIDEEVFYRIARASAAFSKLRAKV